MNFNYLCLGLTSLDFIGLFYTLIMLNCIETSPILLPTTCLSQENADGT